MRAAKTRSKNMVKKLLTIGFHCGNIILVLNDSTSPINARVVELVDSLASGASARKGVRVRLPPRAPMRSADRRDRSFAARRMTVPFFVLLRCFSVASIVFSLAKKKDTHWVSFFLGSGGPWPPPSFGIFMLGLAKPSLRNSPPLCGFEFTAHKRRRPEGRFGAARWHFCNIEPERPASVPPRPDHRIEPNLSLSRCPPFFAHSMLKT